jgi:hypothetical protein
LKRRGDERVQMFSDVEEALGEVHRSLRALLESACLKWVVVRERRDARH